MRRKRFNKKGDVSIQINWIFVLIVGAIILIFFASIITKQKSVSDTHHAIKITEGLDAIFTSAQVATATANEITLPEVNIEFDCNSYYVGDFETGISKDIQDSRVLFVPGRLSGRKLITWSLPWNFPYKITDFLYITSSEIKYIIAHDTSSGMQDFAEEVHAELPDKIDKGDKVINLAQSSIGYTANQNNYKVRYIFFTSTPPDCSDQNPSHCPHPSMNNQKTEVTALHVSSSGDRGKITFYKYDPDEREFIEIGETKRLDFNSQDSVGSAYPSLYGAIFADSLEMYNCMIARAFKRHALITDIYLERITKMKNNASSEMKSLGCPFLYPQPESSLSSLMSAVSSTDCLQNFNSGCSPPDFYMLEQQNEDLQVNSCPLIY